MSHPYYFYALLWYLVGSASFIYWWTKDSDLSTKEIIFVVLSGFIGPLAFLAGWAIHGNSRVIMRRRK